MPNPNTEQIVRREAIRERLAVGPVDTQQSLVEHLTSQGLRVTQSSVSRDLRDLGAIKTAEGYTLPAAHHDADHELDAVSALLRDAQTAGPNLLVIRTAIGAAQRVALALDRSGWPEIVGNIGGDDTVFVATTGSAGQKNLLARIERARA